MPCRAFEKTQVTVPTRCNRSSENRDPFSWQLRMHTGVIKCTSALADVNGLSCSQTFGRTWGQRWDLSWSNPSNEKMQYVSPWVDVKLLTQIDVLPSLLENPKEKHWETGRRLWVQTDNQLVAQAFAEQACLSTEFLWPICIRIGRALADAGWRSRTDSAPFVE